MFDDRTFDFDFLSLEEMAFPIDCRITKLTTTGAIIEGIDLAACNVEVGIDKEGKQAQYIYSIDEVGLYDSFSLVVDQVVALLRKELKTHSLLIFKNQQLSAEKQVELSQLFGDLFVPSKRHEDGMTLTCFFYA